VLAQVRVLLEPAVLNFEVKGPTVLHNHEKHAQCLSLVDKRPFAMQAGCIVLPKACRQCKQQLDIVGKRWCDHGKSSWRAWRLSSRKEPACVDYVNAFMHTSHLYVISISSRKSCLFSKTRVLMLRYSADS
jgi:hypothetical protein